MEKDVDETYHGQYPPKIQDWKVTRLKSIAPGGQPFGQEAADERPDQAIPALGLLGSEGVGENGAEGELRIDIPG